MNKIEIKTVSRTLLMLLTVLTQVLNVQMAKAANDPQIEILTATTPSEISPDAPFAISFKLIGGWAATATNCNRGENGNNPFSIALLEGDSSGNTKAYSWSGYSYKSLSNLNDMDTRIIPEGLQCTVHFLKDTDSSVWVEDWKRWDYYGTTKDIIGINQDSKEDTGPISQIIFGVRNENTKTSVVSTFRATKPSTPIITITGLTRGDEIEYLKKFQVSVDVGKNLPLRKEVYNYGDYGSYCSALSEISNTSTRVVYVSDCYLLHNAIEYTNISAGVSIRAENGTTFKSNEIAVSFTKTGIPNLEWNINKETIYAPSSTTGKGSKYVVNIIGSATLKFRDRTRNFPNHVFDICVDGLCKKASSDDEGRVSISFETSNPKAKVEVTSMFGVEKLPFGSTTTDYKPMSVPATPPKTNSSSPSESSSESSTYKSGQPKGKIDKKSSIYLTTYKIGKNFKLVSTPGETGVKQCNRAQAQGYIMANGHVQYLGVQARYIMSWLRTASGYRGCIDGFGR